MNLSDVVDLNNSIKKAYENRKNLMFRSNFFVFSLKINSDGQQICRMIDTKLLRHQTDQNAK